MSTSENPYAPPVTVYPFAEDYAAKSQGLWRKGTILVMHKRAPLPARCVKSNEPTKGQLKRTLYWHHPAIYLLLLFNLLIYVIVALVLRKSAIIHIGLSDEWFRKRHRAILIGWLSVLVGIGMIFVGAVALDQAPALGWLIALGPLVFLFGAIYGLLASRMVVAQRISDDYVWLKGVHPAYLAELPEWPYYP